MRTTQPARGRGLLFLLGLVALVVGCGGGGGLGPTPPAASLGVLQALMVGGAETVVVDPSARATAFLELSSDGTVSFTCAVAPTLVGQLTGLHVHRGTAGSDGPIVADLLPAATFDAGTGVGQGSLPVPAALAAEIAAAPADFYVNLHTAAAGGGLARQQLGLVEELELWAVMRGDEEVLLADPQARGAASFGLQADGTLRCRLGMASPAATTIETAHIHRAPAGLDGAVFVDLEPGLAVQDPATGLLQRDVAVSWAQAARIWRDPAGFYVNVHTTLAPGGVARGQLGTGVFQAWAPLAADEVTVPPVDTDARGGVTLQLQGFGQGTVHLAVPPAQGIGSVTGAHVRVGAAGVAGPALVDLQAGADYLTSLASFSAEGTIAPGQDAFTRILADPATCYVEFATAADPTGVARGQLGEAAVSFIAVLDGELETTVVDPDATGSINLVVSDVSHCSFTIDMGQPPPQDLTAAHVHDGPAGVDGPALIDLLGGSGTMVSGRFVNGSAEFNGRTFARLLAAPEAFHTNVFTAAAPGGIARGQLQQRTEDLPPAGLIYDSPVSYDEQTPIPANVPSSVGGAITSYAVNPALPAGLALDTLTGVLTGTPTVLAGPTNYTVTATNASGSTTATINIEVVPIPPANLAYASPVTYSVGTAITPNVPSSDGGTITSYAVSPALPSGLSIDGTTGVISGTPGSAAAAANYTVTGSNAAGSVGFAVNITVNAVLQPPSGLSYTTPVTYSTGNPITPNSPTIGGGAVSTWSISPALPAGLAFNTSDGVISGTPTTVTSAADYTVTASNAAGSTTATVNVTVVLGAPSNLTYNNTPNIAYINQDIKAMSPSATGGPITSYSVSPALPAGIVLDTSSGVISGKPTVTSSFTTYTVTASNSAGSTTATVDIVVY